MKLKSGFLILLLATLVASAQTNNLTALLQQGLMEEQANRNLDAAIANYQSLAMQFDQDRQLAATAVFRLGECYRAQGKTNEAAAQYQRILRDFADQKTLATLSQQNLTGMGMTKSETAPADNSDAQLWSKLKDMPRDELEKILPTVVPDAAFTILLQRRNETEATLAQMQVNLSPENPEVLKQKALLDTINKQLDSRLDGIIAGLKMRAELSQPHSQQRLQSVISRNPQSSETVATDDEDKEIARIQQMIQNSPDLINARGEGGAPLAKAAANGWLKVATYLMDHGADVNGSMALRSAISSGNRAMVELLLGRGANVKSIDNSTGRSPLQLAVQNGYQAVAEVLLANKADVNAPDNSGNTPLDSAISGGQVKIVKMLLNAGANPNVVNNDGRTPLSFAASFTADSSSSEMVKLLLELKADPNGGSLDAPLLCAIHNHNTGSAELLLQAGAKPDLKSAVDWTMVINNTQYQGNTPYNRPNCTPLYLAISTKQLPMVNLLLKYKADPNDSQTEKMPVIFNACDNADILEALLEAGGKADSIDLPENGCPLLHRTIAVGNLAAVQAVVKHGANVNLQIHSGGNENGYTPLHVAANKPADRKVFELLLDHHADPNVQGDNGVTPLDLLKRRLKQADESSEGTAKISELVVLLHQHGALDTLPKWDRITISRPSANFSEPLYYQGTNRWNQFTLLEGLLNFYGSSRTHSVSQGNGVWSSYSADAVMPFPDLSRVIIVRPRHGSTNQTRIEVNLLNLTNGIDCSKDIPLEFGDVVEISEREHALGDKPVGLTTPQREALFKYLQASVKLVVRGQTVEIPVYPCFDSSLSAVLEKTEARNLLLSSSDLSQVKVTRRDPKTGKNREWILNCRPAPASFNGAVKFSGITQTQPPFSELWLRDGDVIEVPEKP